MITYYLKGSRHKLSVHHACITAILELPRDDEASVFFNGTSQLVESKEGSATKTWEDACEATVKLSYAHAQDDDKQLPWGKQEAPVGAGEATASPAVTTPPAKTIGGPVVEPENAFATP